MDLSTAKITGVVLAGGRGARMGGCDKGLIPYRGRAMAAHALEALSIVTERVLISANRHHAEYSALGAQVVSDGSAEFQGPLAGILSAMRHAEAPYLLVLPCDVPHLEADHLQRLIGTFTEAQHDICAAHDGVRLHPIVSLLKTVLVADLALYLESGQRKVELWFARHRLVLADFSDCPDVLINLNTPEELEQARLNSIKR